MTVDCAVLAQDSKSYLKGDIQSIKANPRGWGSKIVLPQWIRLTVTGVDVAEAKAYENQWKTMYDFSIVTHNPAKIVGEDIVDLYRIDVFSMYPSASNRNVCTQAQVQDYLERFGMVLKSANTNAIRFDYGVYTTAISEGYLDIDDTIHTLLVFDETDYNQVSGVHTITCDYSATSFSAAKAQSVIERSGGVMLDNSNDVITYSIQRNDLNAEIKSTFRDKLDSVFERRIYKISDATIDAWVSQGGVVEVAKSTLLLSMIDKTSI